MNPKGFNKLGIDLKKKMAEHYTRINSIFTAATENTRKVQLIRHAYTQYACSNLSAYVRFKSGSIVYQRSVDNTTFSLGPNPDNNTDQLYLPAMMGKKFLTWTGTNKYVAQLAACGDFPLHIYVSDRAIALIQYNDDPVDGKNFHMNWDGALYLYEGITTVESARDINNFPAPANLISKKELREEGSSDDTGYAAGIKELYKKSEAKIAEDEKKRQEFLKERARKEKEEYDKRAAAINAEKERKAAEEREKLAAEERRKQEEIDRIERQNREKREAAERERERQRRDSEASKLAQKKSQMYISEGMECNNSGGLWDYDGMYCKGNRIREIDWDDRGEYRMRRGYVYD